MPHTRHETLEDVELREPPMYKVLMNNDDYTTMDFVVMVLLSVFHKSRPEAERLMMQIHKKGRALCGIYPYDVAETKVKQVELLAEKHKYPLSCSIEED